MSSYLHQPNQRMTLRPYIGFSLAIMLLLNGWEIAWAAKTSQANNQMTPHITVPVAKQATNQSINRLTADHFPGTTPLPAPKTAVDRLTNAGFKTEYAALYVAAAQATGTPWQLLAAVHRAETAQSGSTGQRSWAGAIGPMQFMPTTFAAYGIDGNGDGRADSTNLEDAVYSAGRYLAAHGAKSHNYQSALLAYNHSTTYVNRVLADARQLEL